MRLLLRHTALALLILGVADAATAATAPSAPAPAPPKQLSDKEKADDAAAAIKAMREVLGSVNKLMDEARNERDALRLNCVNDRKQKVTGLLKVAETSLEELKGAIRERQIEAVDHEYDKVQTAKTKVDGLKGEAEQCIGLLLYFGEGDGNVQSEAIVPQDLPETDTTTPAPVDVPTFRSPSASPVSK